LGEKESILKRRQTRHYRNDQVKGISDLNPTPPRIDETNDPFFTVFSG
jgi:hypothetical protein